MYSVNLARQHDHKNSNFYVKYFTKHEEQVTKLQVSTDRTAVNGRIYFLSRSFDFPAMSATQWCLIKESTGKIFNPAFCAASPWKLRFFLKCNTNKCWFMRSTKSLMRPFSSVICTLLDTGSVMFFVFKCWTPCLMKRHTLNNAFNSS